VCRIRKKKGTAHNNIIIYIIVPRQMLDVILHESRKTVHQYYSKLSGTGGGGQRGRTMRISDNTYTPPTPRGVKGDGFLPQSFSRPSPSSHNFIMIIILYHPQGAPCTICVNTNCYLQPDDLYIIIYRVGAL